MRVLMFAMALLAHAGLGACNGEPPSKSPLPTEAVEQGRTIMPPVEAGEWNGGPGGGTGGPTITVSGRVFYEDFRKVGRFASRLDPSGVPGQQVDFVGESSQIERNYLAAHDATVLAYEIDNSGGAGCVAKQLVGVTDVKSDGTFDVAIPPNDSCGSEDVTPDIAIEVWLWVCDEYRCVGVREDGPNKQTSGPIYSLEHPLATNAAPQAMFGDTDLGDMFFQVTDFDVNARAASVFASVVDVTRRVYLSYNMLWTESDPIRVEFPDTHFMIDNAGNLVVHLTPAGGQDDQGNATGDLWRGGRTAMHELGHVMHRVAWGNYGICSLGDSDGDGEDDYQAYQRDGSARWQHCSFEFGLDAFREGFADFVQRWTLDGLEGGCSEITFDPNVGPSGEVCNADPEQYPDTQEPVTYVRAGRAYARNVTKVLCDLVDSETDDDPNLPGDGDHLHVSLMSVWQTLEDMSTPTSNCLDVCDFLNHFVDHHSPYLTTPNDFSQLAHQNALSCRLPSVVPGEACATGEAPSAYSNEDCAINADPAKRWCRIVGPDGERSLICETFTGDVENNITVIEDYGATGDIVVFGDMDYVNSTNDEGICCHFAAADTQDVTRVVINTTQDADSDDTIHYRYQSYDIGNRATRTLTFGGNDEIDGGPGPDVVFAGADDDIIHTFEGDDYLDGQDGFDQCIGGPGQDTFAFDHLPFPVSLPGGSGLPGNASSGAQCEVGVGYATLHRVGNPVAGAEIEGQCPSAGVASLSGGSLPDWTHLECGVGETLDVTCSFTGAGAEVGIIVDDVRVVSCQSSPCTYAADVDADLEVKCDFDAP
ncbi:MAG: calcium-binding protein [Myxococcota bacterium]